MKPWLYTERFSVDGFLLASPNVRCVPVGVSSRPSHTRGVLLIT
jgi:hypothetical protein